MLWFLATTIIVLTSLYFAGSLLRQSTEIDAFVKNLELNYAKINAHVKDTTMRSGLNTLALVYAICAGAALAVLIVALLIGIDPKRLSWLFSIVGFSCGAWFSLKWAFDHKAMLRVLRGDTIKVVLLPLGLGLAQTLLQVKLFPTLPGLAQTALAPLFVMVPPSGHPILIGGICSGAMAFGMVFYYLAIWVFVTPAATASVFLVAVAVSLARFLNRWFPAKPFAGFCALLFIGASYALGFV
jgi:hypothetical protein